MLGGSHDYIVSQQNSFHIKQDDKFFSKLLSKEKPKPIGEASFRLLYYGGNSSAIPFLWESQPGTPKHPLSHSSLPPLTPPPSYHLNPRSQSTRKIQNTKLAFNIFKRNFFSKKDFVIPTNISSLSTSSPGSPGSRSAYSDSMKSYPRHQGCFSGSSIFRYGVRSSGFGKESKESHSKLYKMFTF